MYQDSWGICDSKKWLEHQLINADRGTLDHLETSRGLSPPRQHRVHSPSSNSWPHIEASLVKSLYPEPLVP